MHCYFVAFSLTEEAFALPWAAVYGGNTHPHPDTGRYWYTHIISANDGAEAMINTRAKLSGFADVLIEEVEHSEGERLITDMTRREL